MEHVVSADGTLIAIERLGAGPSIALIHSGFVDRRLWLPSAKILAERFSVVLCDRRGRGESGPYRDDHAIEREFEDVAAIVESLDPPVTLVGHSSSAWYVLYGARLAGGVHRLVLYEPPPLWTVAQQVVDDIHASVTAGAVDEAIATLLTEAIGMPAAAVAGMEGSPFWQLLAANASAFAPELQAGRAFRFDASLFERFDTPTLLLLGTESPPFLRPITEQVALALPTARIRELAGQGHGAMSSAPDLFASEVADFVSGHEPGHSQRSVAHS
jgi:pimeloyl-ACP methyl ester carboxylesterase